MPPLTDERAWLGTTFNVGKFEPGTNEHALESAKKAYERVAGDPLVATQMEAAELKQDFETLTKTPPTDLGGYQNGLEKILDLRAQALVTIDKQNKELSDLFAESQKARLCAKNTLALLGDVSNTTDKFIQRLQKIDVAEKQAIQFRDQHKYKDAIAQLKTLLEKYKKCETEIRNAEKTAREDTEKAQAKESEAFKLYAGDSKQMRDMIGDPALMQLLVGGVITEETTKDKSEQLKKMEEALTDALKRYDALRKKGLSAPDAADIALANIPRAFWPDRAIREIDMFYRVERQIEVEQAERTAKEIGEAFLEGVTIGEEYADLAVTTTGDYIDYVLKMQLGLKAKDSIPKPGTKDFEKLNSNQQSIINDNAQLIEIQKAFAISGKVAGGLGVGLKAIDAIIKIKNATGEFEGPVQQKTAEFERNKAIFELLLGAKNYGADLLKDVFPPLGVIAKGVDVAKAAYDAAVYFKMLADIKAIGKKAERDPKSVVYLPLVRMAKHEWLKAAESVVKFVESALAVVGKSLEMGGITAAGGLAIDATGKIVAQGSKFVFANIRWSDARKAKSAIAKAKGPPVDREMVAKVFKYSNRYATYCLAIAAVEDQDAWAIRYCTTNGLTEGEVSDPATSIMVLRKYILVRSDMDDEQATFGETIPGRLAGGAAQGIKALGRTIGDKVRGRKTDAPYEPEYVMDDESGEQIANPKFVAPTRPTAIGDLTRTNWKAAKEQAIKAGWYDDRSGLGDEFDHFQEIVKAWNAIDSLPDDQAKKQTAQNAFECVRNLDAFVKSINPTTNDRKSLHEGMNQYLVGVLLVLNGFAEKVNEKRDTLLKGQDDEKILQEAYEKLKENNKKLREEANKKLKELIADYRWDTPFGASRLGDYQDLVISTLGINPTLVDGAVQDAVDGLTEEVIFAEARAYLGGYTADQLDKPFKTMASSLLSKLTYRGLAEIALEARNLRDNKNPPSTPAKLQQQAALTVAAWKAAMIEAVGIGLKESKGATAIQEVLEEYETEFKRFTTSNVGSYGANAQDRLRKLREKLEAYDPVDNDGLPFAIMETFLEDLDKLIDPQIEQIELGATGGWMPKDSDFELTSAGWETIKKTAIDNLMGDKSTGIGSALKSFEKEVEKFKKDNSDENRLNCIKAIDKLAEKIGGFKPETKSGKTHPGAVELRNLLVSKATAKRKEFADVQSLKNARNIVPTTIDAKQWENDKKNFIRHGLVDSSTGIGKAIKSYVSAREKFDRDSASEKQREAYNEKAKSLVTTLETCKPETTFKTPFDPAVTYTKKLAELVRAEMRTRLPWLANL